MNVVTGVGMLSLMVNSRPQHMVMEMLQRVIKHLSEQIINLLHINGVNIHA